MIFRFFAALLLVATPKSVWAQNDWTNDDIWILVGEGYGLASLIKAQAFKHSVVHAQMRRVGIDNSCRLISEFVEEEVGLRREQYRLAVLDEFGWWASKIEPQQFLAFAPNGGRFDALLRGVERRDPGLFADAYETIPTKLIPLLEAQPENTDDWSAPVIGWDFESSNHTIWASACIVANGENPEARRLLFDGFYMKRPD